MEKYKIIKSIGNGNFGDVFKATNTQTGEMVAIKKFKKKYADWDDCLTEKEIHSLRKMNHRNIIKLKEVLHVND